MPQLQRKYARELYHPELQALMEYGEPVKVGDRETMEILNFSSIVEEPWHHCILLPSRRWNPWLAMSEGLWILAGRNDVEPLARFNNNIANFSDDGSTLYGAYGKRIFADIDNLIERLRRDPNDRRAILTIWNREDLTAQTKDPPCNDMIMFKLRQGKLHMTVINRSNDIHWGLFAVNLPTFSMLQVYIAARLQVQVGTQTHFSNSLHVYTDHEIPKTITERMLFREAEDRPKYPEHEFIFTHQEMKGFDHQKFAEHASAALDGRALDHNNLLFFNFAASFLKQYERREIDYTLRENYPEFNDWNLAAEIFAEKVWKVKVKHV